jgi:hypothetical protein
VRDPLHCRSWLGWKAAKHLHAAFCFPNGHCSHERFSAAAAQIDNVLARHVLEQWWTRVEVLVPRWLPLHAFVVIVLLLRLWVVNKQRNIASLVRTIAATRNLNGRAGVLLPSYHATLMDLLEGQTR